MPNRIPSNGPKLSRAYIVTGPTSGIGRATALELAKYGTVVLVGRDRPKLGEVKLAIESNGGSAVFVVCDLSDIANVRRAAEEISALGLPIAGLLNNAGVLQTKPTQSAQGWDMSFATNHLGPFALTEALAPNFADGTNVVFLASAVEDPERKPAHAAGFRGGRYLSAQASARGEWAPGGSTKRGFDAYATSKQAVLAATLALARETPRLRFNAVEPGVTPATGLARDHGAFVRLLSKSLIPLLVPLFMPFVPYLSTPKRAARMISRVLTNNSNQTGTYYDESGHPMLGSALVRDPQFQDRVLAETRALLAEAARTNAA